MFFAVVRARRVLKKLRIGEIKLLRLWITHILQVQFTKVKSYYKYLFVFRTVKPVFKVLIEQLQKLTVLNKKSGSLLFYYSVRRNSKQEKSSHFCPFYFLNWEIYYSAISVSPEQDVEYTDNGLYWFQQGVSAPILPIHQLNLNYTALQGAEIFTHCIIQYTSGDLMRS